MRGFCVEVQQPVPLSSTARLSAWAVDDNLPEQVPAVCFVLHALAAACLLSSFDCSFRDSFYVVVTAETPLPDFESGCNVLPVS